MTTRLPAVENRLAHALEDFQEKQVPIFRARCGKMGMWQRYSEMRRCEGLRRRLRPHLRYSFGGREADHVGRLVAGASAHICDECITKCVAVLEQHGGFVAAAEIG
jgi:hypothetical protein